MRVIDIALQPFAYTYDTFTTCSNLRRVTTSDTIIVTKSSSLILLLPIFHYSPINFTSRPIVQSYSILPPTSTIFHHIVPFKHIFWLSFDSVPTSFGSLFSPWSGGSV